MNIARHTLTVAVIVHAVVTVALVRRRRHALRYDDPRLVGFGVGDVCELCDLSNVHDGSGGRERGILRRGGGKGEGYPEGIGGGWERDGAPASVL